MDACMTDVLTTDTMGPNQLAPESLATRECVYFSSGTTPATILTPETSPLCLREDEILMSTVLCDCQEVKGTHDSCLPRGEKKSLMPPPLFWVPCPHLMPTTLPAFKDFRSWECISSRMLAWHL